MTEALILPTFDLSTDLTDEDIAKASERVEIKHGEQDLEILAVEYKGAPQKDPTWARFSVVLGAPGTEKNAEGKFKGVVYHSVMTPTRSIKYGPDQGLFSFLSLQGFLASLGVMLSTTNLKVIGEIFANGGSALVGKKLRGVVGYEGAYIKRNGDVYQYVDKSGKIPDKITSIDGAYSEANSFTSGEAADGACKLAGLKASRYVSVIKFIPSEVNVFADTQKSAKTKATTFEE